VVHLFWDLRRFFFAPLTPPEMDVTITDEELKDLGAEIFN
jgi:hypothetical protein